MGLRAALLALGLGLASGSAFRRQQEVTMSQTGMMNISMGSMGSMMNGSMGGMDMGGMMNISMGSMGSMMNGSMGGMDMGGDGWNKTDDGFQFGITPLTIPPSEVSAPSFAFIYQSFTPVFSDFLPTVNSSRADECWGNGTIPCLVAEWTSANGSYVATNYSIVCTSDGQCPCYTGSTMCNVTVPDPEQLRFAGGCLPAAVQSCPATCKNPCVSYKYDMYGQMEGGDMGFANMTCGSCSCDPMMEIECTVNNQSQCLPKADLGGTCPMDCGPSATACPVQGYDQFRGWTATQTCLENLTSCPWIPLCDNVTADTCLSDWGSYCQRMGTCPPPPMTCPTGQKVCYGQNADTMEDTGMCMSGPECPCRMDQQNCTSTWAGFTTSYCSDYPCPVSCDIGQQLCYGQNKSTAYTMLDTGMCMDASVPCPCRDDQQNCSSSDGSYSWCSDYSCPVYCREDQQLCYGQNASTAHTMLDTGVCMDAAMPCPCGEGQQTCNAFGMTYCSSFGCPLDCGDTSVNQTCTVYSYLPDGSLDWGSLDNLVCAPVTSPCPCGNNSRACTFSGSSYCLPTMVSGYALQCPLDCKDTEQQCFIVDYDATGNFAGYHQSCAALNATCPCSGSNTQTCKDEFGSPYCLPTVDAFSGLPMACPVACNALTENTCHIPRYDLDGNVLAVNTSCVPNGQSCPCPSQVTIGSSPVATNARPCNYTFDDGSSFIDCMPSAYYMWCPSAVQCPPSTPQACPAVSIFDGNGSFVKMGNPYCVANGDSCGCGDPSPQMAATTKFARNCTLQNQTFCFPAVDPVTQLAFVCPMDCPADRPRPCDIVDFDAAGSVTGQRQICVGPEDRCPCGANASQPSGGGTCLSTATAKALDPGCGDTKYACWVEDFNVSTGASLGKSQVCQMKGQGCPCGAGAYDKAQGGPCQDPIDNSTVCIPQALVGRYGCPTPCTPADEQKGKAICVQTHLDKSGNYVATSVSCVNGTDACEPGQNQKKCPSGALIFTGAICQDLYGASGNSSVGLPAGSSQSAEMVMTLDAGNITADGVGKQANNVQANLMNVLQLGSDLQLDVSFVTPNTTGATAGRRLSADSKIQVVISVKSTGKAKVAPSLVASKAKSMASTGTDSFSKAFAVVGTPNAKAGFSTSSITKATAVASNATKAVQAMPGLNVAISVNTTQLLPNLMNMSAMSNMSGMSSVSNMSNMSNLSSSSNGQAVVTGSISVGGFDSLAAVQSFGAAAAPVMAKTICDQLSLPATSCSATLQGTPGSRRMQAGPAESRRLASYSAVFGYQINVPAAGGSAAVVSVVSTLGSPTVQSQIWTNFKTQAATAGISVPATAAPVWSSPAVAVAPLPSTTSTTAQGQLAAQKTNSAFRGDAAAAVLCSLVAFAATFKIL